MNETLFILGREPELSTAELEAVAKRWSATVTALSTEAALVSHEIKLPDRALDRLGGSVKQVTVLERWPLTTNLVATLVEKLSVDWMQRLFPGDGRIEFGLSAYNTSNSERAAVKRQALRLKKELTVSSQPVRYVTSREPQLSAVTVQRNGLIKKGKEIVLIKNGQEIIVGVTTAVQDYQLYGLRDFGRPAANPTSGMLPPKLAQMMLNIAAVKSEDILFDPYCGSGTVLQEAALMGVQELRGSDLESRAVKDSQENLRWLFKEFPDVHANVEITMHDARQANTTADVIVTEPYLGKPLRGHEPADWLHQQAKELQTLYLRSFEQWKKKLRPGARVVMIWPEFVVGEAAVTIGIEQAIANLGFRQETLLSSAAAVKLNIENPKVLVYARDEAKVRRQIRKWTLG